jgi:lipopolysaccharide biosynthesis glycosyltransferase
LRTALVFTPDSRFFAPALRTARWALAQDDSDAFDVIIACEQADIPKGFTPPDSRITILTADFAKLTAGLAGRAHFSAAVFRRLVLHRVLPSHYSRIINMDADMFVAGPGLGTLSRVDLGGHVLAASIDMIRFLEMKGDALGEAFAAYRRKLGLAPDDLYFNNGLTVMDRAKFADGEYGERALDFIRREPELCPFLDQSALNHLLRGNQFAALSPRCNFMGDFHILDLEAEIRPFIYHFVNHPKPWDPDYQGDPRFAALYADASDRPVLPKAGPQKVDRPFREKLLEFLAAQHFVDA